MTYPPLPTCPGRTGEETNPEYAARVLRFILAENCTVTLTDDQLVLADHAAMRAICQMRGEDGRASRLEIAQHQTITILSATRHTIQALLTWRRRQDAQTPQPAAPACRPATNGGRLAPLEPPPITRPPGPAYALPGRKQTDDGIGF